jgi:hypothetical protein
VFEQIDKDYGTILDGYQEVEQNLAKLDTEWSGKPPSLSSVKDGQLLVMGGTLGAALGAGAGLGSNVLTSWAARPSIDVTTQEHVVNKPVLTGHTQPIRQAVTEDVPRWGQNGEPLTPLKRTIGWMIRHEPSIETRKVGEYTTQDAKVSDGGVSNPLADAAVGAAIGAAGGVVLAGGIVLARKLTGKGEYVPGEEVKTQGDMQVMLKMGVQGAVGGAIAGGLSSLLANGNAVEKTIVNERPVMQNQVLGTIPADYQIDVNNTQVTRPGTREIRADVPQTEGLFNRLKVEKTEQHLTAGGLDFATSVAGGAAAGFGAGVLAGVFTNVLRKTL